MRETIRWEADANGITPIVVTGTGPPAPNRVCLQSSSELVANSGADSTLSGDGVSLELDLSAINSSKTLTLIDNLTSDPIQGFFENGVTTNLYAEGASLAGTGFNGTVSISYTGGSGNDVVLNLIAAPISGDHNADGIVDAADYVVWRNTDSGNPQGYIDWRNNFGATSASGQSFNTAVPEPPTLLLTVLAFTFLLAQNPAGNRA